MVYNYSLFQLHAIYNYSKMNYGLNVHGGIIILYTACGLHTCIHIRSLYMYTIHLFIRLR